MIAYTYIQRHLDKTKTFFAKKIKSGKSVSVVSRVLTNSCLYVDQKHRGRCYDF
jgi:uncharacterized membrane protein YvbJ